MEGSATRLRAPLVTGAVIGGLTIALRVRDPHTSGSWGLCPFFALTGSYCPGCGALRAVNDLTHADLLGAASSNLLFVLAIPLVVLLWVRWTARAWSGDPRPDGSAIPGAIRRLPTVWAVGAVAATTIAFTVLRNLPTGSWLAP